MGACVAFASQRQQRNVVLETVAVDDRLRKAFSRDWVSPITFSMLPMEITIAVVGAVGVVVVAESATKAPDGPPPISGLLVRTSPGSGRTIRTIGRLVGNNDGGFDTSTFWQSIQSDASNPIQ